MFSYISRAQCVLTTYRESATQQWRKSAPPILSTSHWENYIIMVPDCAPTFEKPSTWHPFTCLLDRNSTFIEYFNSICGNNWCICTTPNIPSEYSYMHTVPGHTHKATYVNANLDLHRLD